jgi:hypothetical protein
MLLPVIGRPDETLLEAFERIEPRISGRKLCGVTCTTARLDYCYPRYNESEGRHVLLIYSNDTVTDSWRLAAQLVRDLMLHEMDEMPTNLQSKS